MTQIRVENAKKLWPTGVLGPVALTAFMFLVHSCKKKEFENKKFFLSDSISTAVFLSGSEAGKPYFLKLGDTVKTFLNLEIEKPNYFNRASSIAFSKSDTYVTGVIDDPAFQGIIAVYWKNGKIYRLTNGSSTALASSVALSPTGDVYIAGTENIISSSTKSSVRVWKNGQLFATLTDGSTSAFAKKIIIEGNDVYVAGIEGDTIKYWKNSQLAGKIQEQLGWSVNFGGMVVRNGDVFISSSASNSLSESFEQVVRYWKNGIPTTITGPEVYGTIPYADGIAISNKGEVYVGYDAIQKSNPFTRVCKIWKDGKVMPVTDGSRSESITDMIITDTDDLYVSTYSGIVGSESSTLYKNYQKVNLPSNNNPNLIQSITIKK